MDSRDRFADAEASAEYVRRDGVDVVFLWDIPEAEFPAWVAMQADEGQSNPLFTIADYRARLAAMVDAYDPSVRVVMVPATVQQMRDACRDCGVNCDPAGRAIALTQLGIQTL